jgi:hypothetical protein
VTASTTLRTLLRRNPQWDRFDWSLFVVSLEIDLRVEIPQRIADAHQLTVATFAKKVAALPRVAAPDYTLQILTLLAQAVLSADEADVTPSNTSTKPSRKKAHSKKRPSYTL